MKTTIIIEWEGTAKQQTHSAEGGTVLSPFINCIVGDALNIFLCQRSGHEVQEVSMTVSGYKVTVNQHGK